MSFEIKQEKFEGPLELLLELVEKEKLAIGEISLAKVANDYVSYVRSMTAIDPEALAQFLVVAAQLMLIKSRALLPDLKLAEEEEESIEELGKRLEEYKKIRDLAKNFGNMAGERNWIATREGYSGIEVVFYPPPKLSVTGFASAFAAFISTIPKIEKLTEEKLKRVISLEEKVAHIKSFLQDALERGFSEVVRGAKEKVEVIVSFLAMLELVQQKFLEFEQKGLFDEITLRKL